MPKVPVMTSATWRLPGYHVDQLLGFGGAGEVWRGRVAATGEVVALKRIRVEDPDQLSAARREAALLGTLDHPNLVRLHDVLATADSLVLVLDLAGGGSLAQLVAARGRLSPGETISALAPIAAALAHAHAAGVVHGDVTPANVLFSELGLPLLTDLGVARVVGDDVLVRSTPSFVDPGVATSGMPGPHSDVFMIGGVALFALTGRPVWSGASAEEALAQAAAGKLADVPARLAGAGVPAQIAEVVARALQREPEFRGTAAEFALDLRHAGRPVAVELGAGRARSAPARAGAPAARGRHAAAELPVHRASAPAAADPARPDFERPGPAPLPPAEPLTHGVRLRPLAARPARRRWRRRVLGSVALAAAATVLGIGAWRLGPWRPSAAATPAATPAAVAMPTTAKPAAATPAAAKPTTSVAVGSVAQGAALRAELMRLDAVRERAFAQRAPALLAQVYRSAVLLEQDAELVRRLVPPGCGLFGLRTSFREVTVASSAGARIEVRAQVTLAPSALVCRGRTQARTPALGPTTLHIVLMRDRDGYHIAGQRRA